MGMCGSGRLSETSVIARNVPDPLGRRREQREGKSVWWGIGGGTAWFSLLIDRGAALLGQSRAETVGRARSRWQQART